MFVLLKANCAQRKLFCVTSSFGVVPLGNWERIFKGSHIVFFHWNMLKARYENSFLSSDLKREQLPVAVERMKICLKEIVSKKISTTFSRETVYSCRISLKRIPSHKQFTEVFFQCDRSAFSRTQGVSFEPFISLTISLSLKFIKIVLFMPLKEPKNFFLSVLNSNPE